MISYICWYCPLGYPQGMSDMLSPILYVVDNEVDAFWCLYSLMERMVSINWSLESAVHDAMCYIWDF